MKENRKKTTIETVAPPHDFAQFLNKQNQFVMAAGCKYPHKIKLIRKFFILLRMNHRSVNYTEKKHIVL